MKINNFHPQKSTGEDGNAFVGLRIRDNEIFFHYPEAYDFNEEDYSRNDILDLLKTISIAKSSSDDVNGKMFSLSSANSELALLSYLWIIEDYVSHGLYIDREKVNKFNRNGRVNWKKTFRELPMISNGNVIYNRLSVDTYQNTLSLLVQIHQYCVWKSLELMGWLYDISSAEVESKEITAMQKVLYLDVLQKELGQTFDDIKRTRLQHMKNVLIGLNEEKDHEELVYGVDSYQYVFERMIDHIFGTETKESIRNYYPKVTWNLEYPQKHEPAGSTLRPDTIMRTDKGIYIIDSKYYRYGSLDISQTQGLPDVASIQKQIIYGSYISEIQKTDNVYNVFILPYNKKKTSDQWNIVPDTNLLYAGNACANWNEDKSYSQVHTLLIDLKYVISTWASGLHQSDKDILQKLIDETGRQ